MCLILFSWKAHSHHDLIVAANRDEFYNRPTRSAHAWQESPDLIAGKDLTAGGTWMGITKSGRFAALTNYRDPANINPEAPSRGHLTKEFLLSEVSPEAYLQALKKRNEPYNGFNLLVGNHDTLCYYNNVNHEIKALKPGIYGLSNALLNDPWPKVKQGMNKLKSLMKQDHPSAQALIKIVQNKSLASDQELPNTGVPIDWERSLSAMFIEMDGYGTRCSTAILKTGKKVHFNELTYSHLGQKKEEVEFIL